jgi:surface antigen
MQFADRTLGVADSARIAEALARDPDLRKRLDAFVETGRALGAPFGEVLKAPVPPRLVDAIMSGGRGPGMAAPAAPRADPFGGIKSLFDGLFSFGRPRWAPAFATALLLAGGVVGWQMQRVAHNAQAAGQLRVDNGRIAAQGTLASALETAAAGDTTRDATQDVSVKVRLTFKSKAQAYCRQYDIARGGEAFAGLACRAPDGQWQVQYHAPTAVPPSSGDRTVPVGDAKALLGALIDAMSGSDPLDREEEARVRDGHWH